MKIVSKFYDYYDYLQSYDDTRSFYRETTKISSCPQHTGYIKFLFQDDLEYKHFNPKYDHYHMSYLLEAYEGIVFFCGKVYPVMKTIL